MLNSSDFSLRLKVLSISTSLQWSESEFRLVGALTEKAYDDKASDVQGTDSKLMSVDDWWVFAAVRIERTVKWSLLYNKRPEGL